MVAALAPEGLKARQEENDPAEDHPKVPISNSSRSKNSSWARLLAKVYEDPMICPRCGSELKVIAVIQRPEDVMKILRHLVRIGRGPPGLDPATLN